MRRALPFFLGEKSNVFAGTLLFREGSKQNNDDNGRYSGSKDARPIAVSSEIIPARASFITVACQPMNYTWFPSTPTFVWLVNSVIHYF